MAFEGEGLNATPGEEVGRIEFTAILFPFKPLLPLRAGLRHF